MIPFEGKPSNEKGSEESKQSIQQNSTDPAYEAVPGLASSSEIRTIDPNSANIATKIDSRNERNQDSAPPSSAKKVEDELLLEAQTCLGLLMIAKSVGNPWRISRDQAVTMMKLFLSIIKETVKHNQGSSLKESQIEIPKYLYSEIWKTEGKRAIIFSLELIGEMSDLLSHYIELNKTWEPMMKRDTVIAKVKEEHELRVEGRHFLDLAELEIGLDLLEVPRSIEDRFTYILVLLHGFIKDRVALVTDDRELIERQTAFKAKQDIAEESRRLVEAVKSCPAKLSDVKSLLEELDTLAETKMVDKLHFIFAFLKSQWEEATEVMGSAKKGLTVYPSPDEKEDKYVVKVNAPSKDESSEEMAGGSSPLDGRLRLLEDRVKQLGSELAIARNGL